MKCDLEVWIARLPDFELRPSRSNGHRADYAPRTDGTDSPSSDMVVFDHLRTDGFVRLDQFPAVICRDMPAVATATHGQVTARVLRANTARPWPQPPWPRRTTAARISLLVAGTVWFDFAGVGEESFSAKDSWCLPAGVDHALLEASSDFELLEIEMPVPPGSPVAASAIPEMLMMHATYSYRPIPCFGEPAEHTEHPPAETVHHGASAPLKLDDRTLSGSARCGYLTGGTARIDVEGVGVVDAQPGTFWFQQASKQEASLSRRGR